MSGSQKLRVEGFNCPNCGAAAAPDSVKCPYCHSSIATRVCPCCYGAVAIGMAHCPSCGAEVVSGTPGKEVTLPCPRCRLALSVVPVGSHTLHECLRCGGLWVKKAAFQDICTSQEEQEAVLGIGGEAESAGGSPPGVQRVYVPCPECGKLMNRKNFAGCSGVVLDWCREHGSWFDRRELQQIITFVRSGGLRKSRQRELAHIQEQRARLQEQQQFMTALAGRTGTQPIVGVCSALEIDPLLEALSVLFNDPGN